MTRSCGKRSFQFKNVIPKDPAVQAFGEWSGANRGFYDRFRHWLKDSSYSDSAINIYGVAARLAIGYLHKEYWQMDPEADISHVIAFLEQRPLSPSTRADYRKGLAKFADYLRLSLHRPQKPRELPWGHHVGALPEWLQQDIRDFICFRQNAWKTDLRHERSVDTLCSLSRPLRWMAANFALKEVGAITPALWHAWLGHRLEAGISPTTVNGELSVLKHLLHFLRERERPVCERFLLLDRLKEGSDLPKDVPVEQLRRLQEAIQQECSLRQAGRQRLGRMDLAWFLLMVHCGLRTGEVRNLKLADIEWESACVRIRQSKGLKDRLVWLSEPAMGALQGYLQVRGPARALPDNVFIFRHAPLSRTYCLERLRTYGERCDVRVAPHRLRHSCATLLLNAGAPVLSVQMILGHKQIDTTLGYARLYDGTVAADYYAAMNRVERQLALPEDRMAEPPRIGYLLALVDTLHRSALSPAQSEIVRTLREGLGAMAEKEAAVV